MPAAEPPGWPSMVAPPMHMGAFCLQDELAVAQALEIADGYPYFLEAVGKYVWDAAPTDAARRSAGATREEHQLSAGPIGRVAYVVHGVAVRDQRRLDLVSLPKAQGRV